MFKPSPYQQAVFDFVEKETGSAIVEAVAGSGKTTTIVQALERIDPKLATVFLAFNKSIADELKSRVPPYVEAMTLNSMGHRAWARHVGQFVKVNANKTRDIAKATLPQESWGFMSEICKLVGLAKAHGLVPENVPGADGLMPDSDIDWTHLIERYGLDVEVEDRPRVINHARVVLMQSCFQKQEIDFDDQLYLTVIYNVPVAKFDWLFVDEAQDVSHIQRAMLRKALKPGGRLVAVGDPAQAIYGFRGADSMSLDNIASDFSAKRLPLSISYRCPQSVVAYAQQVVDHIQAASTAPEGKVYSLPMFCAGDFRDGDLVICRNTAPIVSLAYSLLARKVPVKVLGRDIGAGLTRLIKKLKPNGVHGSKGGLVQKLEKWAAREQERRIAKGDDAGAESVADKHDSLMAFIDNLPTSITVPGLISEIEALFNKKNGSVTLCTIHKAKGLEAPRVFVLDEHLMPSRYARQEWQRQQEKNLMYVAFTRAKSELVFIYSDRFVARNETRSEVA